MVGSGLASLCSRGPESIAWPGAPWPRQGCDARPVTPCPAAGGHVVAGVRTNEGSQGSGQRLRERLWGCLEPESLSRAGHPGAAAGRDGSASQAPTSGCRPPLRLRHLPAAVAPAADRLHHPPRAPTRSRLGPGDATRPPARGGFPTRLLAYGVGPSCMVCRFLIMTASAARSSSLGLNHTNSVPGSCCTGTWPGGV